MIFLMEKDWSVENEIFLFEGLLNRQIIKIKCHLVLFLFEVILLISFSFKMYERIVLMCIKDFVTTGHKN